MRWFVPILSLVVVVAVGCSEATRDRLAHFFFEVPAADAAREDATPEDAGPGLGIEPQFASVHAPYAEKQCTACHAPENQMRVLEDLTDACRACHPTYFGDAVEHEPVAEGECATCHQGHRSQHPALLRSTVLDACTECHDPPEDLSEEAHGGAGVENCITCHDPHFGGAPYLKGSSESAGG
ncbi:MAG: hypothetical protein GY842_15900 [bacterium]|nr:hypothetical protein [bacterium]